MKEKTFNEQEIRNEIMLEHNELMLFTLQMSASSDPDVLDFFRTNKRKDIDRIKSIERVHLNVSE